METRKRVPPSAEAEGLFSEFQRHDAEALAAARTRLDGLARQVSEMLERHEARLREAMADLQKRVQEARMRCERESELLRAGLSQGRMSPDEFRAHVLTLEMEYASRCRIAEHGAQMAAEELRSLETTAETLLANLARRSREALEEQALERSRLPEILQVQAERARRLGGRVARAASLVRRLRERLRRSRAEPPPPATPPAQTPPPELEALRAELERAREAARLAQANLAEERKAAEERLAELSARAAARQAELSEAAQHTDSESARASAEIRELELRAERAEEGARGAIRERAAADRRAAAAEAEAAELKKAVRALEERLGEAIAGRDLALETAKTAEEGGLQPLLAAVAQHQEKAIGYERDLAALRDELQRTKDTMVRQDEARLKEIFELKSRLEKK